MKKIRVKQIRSQINRPQDQKATLEALGLGRINRQVEHELTPHIQGMIDKVQHLVSVEAIN